MKMDTRSSERRRRIRFSTALAVAAILFEVLATFAVDGAATLSAG